MKKILSLLLICALILQGCSSQTAATMNDSSEETAIEASAEISQKAIELQQESTVENFQAEEQKPIPADEPAIEFEDLDDEGLLRYVENNIYSELIDDLDSDEYFVENVSAKYISNEYLEELAYNSQANIYFGYTLDELENEFAGEKYIFTLGEDGTTIVQAFEDYDDTYEKVLKNVAIGSGVILVCVTVSAVTGETAPAVSMIFAMSAKSGTVAAVSSGALCGVMTGVVTGVQSGDMDEAVKAGTLAGSEGFRWGAITGTITGGTGETIGLFRAARNGLTITEAAILQRRTKWPLKAISCIHSMAEAEIYEEAGLVPVQLASGEWAFIREIDWGLIDDSGRTNIERIAEQLAPIDEMGKPYELHHMGMKADSPLAILTCTEHHASENYKSLHYAKEGKHVADAVWNEQKNRFWNEIVTRAVTQG